jgi:hypothetical protein
MDGFWFSDLTLDGLDFFEQPTATKKAAIKSATLTAAVACIPDQALRTGRLLLLFSELNKVVTDIGITSAAVRSR